MTGVWRSEEHRLTIKKEGAYGYKADTTAWAVSDITEPVGLMRGYTPPDPEREWIEKYQLGAANSRRIEQLIEGKYTLNGNIPFVMQNAKMFAYALGSDSFNAGTHTIKTEKALPSFAMMVSRLDGGAGNDYHRIFSGSKIDQFSIGADDSGEVKASMNVISQNVTINSADAAPTVTGYDDELYWFKDSTMTFWGSPIGRLQDFELTISNNLKPKRYFKSTAANTLSELLEGKQQFNIKATVTVDDASVYTQLLSGIGFDISLEFERGTNDSLLIGSDISAVNGSIGGGNHMCRIIKAPHVVPEDDEVNVPIEIVMQNMYVVAADDYGGSYLA